MYFISIRSVLNSSERDSDAALELAVSLVAAAGHEAEDLDSAGMPVNGELRTLLQELFLRSPEIAALVDRALRRGE